MSKTFTFVCLLMLNGALLSYAANVPLVNAEKIMGKPLPLKNCKFTIVSNENLVNTPQGPISEVHAIADFVNLLRKTAAKASLVADGLDNNIDYVDYEGTNCNVKFEFWSNKNYAGSYKYYTVKGKKSGRITLSDFMSHAVSSYKFSYL